MPMPRRLIDCGTFDLPRSTIHARSLAPLPDTATVLRKFDDRPARLGSFAIAVGQLLEDTGVDDPADRLALNLSIISPRGPGPDGQNPDVYCALATRSECSTDTIIGCLAAKSVLLEGGWLDVPKIAFRPGVARTAERYADYMAMLFLVMIENTLTADIDEWSRIKVAVGSESPSGLGVDALEGLLGFKRVPERNRFWIRLPDLLESIQRRLTNAQADPAAVSA